MRATQCYLFRISIGKSIKTFGYFHYFSDNLITLFCLGENIKYNSMRACLARCNTIQYEVF